ncbi:MAG: protein translocase subunit SecD [Fimbriimonadaceae bacterium]|nr:protein translocase subunit SecD [Fimbriimonadaceae bacterium]
MSAVLILAALSIFFFTRSTPQYGLDVRGGVRLTFSMDTSELTPEQKRNPELLQSKTVTILESRASRALGVTEATVQPKGENQIIVELPDYTDEVKAKESMSTTAKIIAYHAVNVTTPTGVRRFTPIAADPDGRPEVHFTSISDPSKVITPEMPEYAEIIAGWTKIIEGEEISDALALIQGNRTMPEFKWNRTGQAKMEAWSRQSNMTQENLAFVLDGRVLSIAPLRPGAVLSTGAFIEGDFDPGYVNTLTTLIKSGSLPVSLKVEASEKVDPTIGRAALNEMITAGLISLGIICAFLIVYYAFPGVVAAIAMVLYTIFTLTVMMLIGATFSLAGIAGLILSAAMAVDANILVFERVKEELRHNKKLMTAIELGFKRAFGAIVDSNACTIITSLVLFTLGTGPVKGFASTLIIGVLMSFFTAIIVTRAILIGLVSIGVGNHEKYYAMNRSWFGEKLEKEADTKPLQIIGKSKTYFIISLVIIAPGLVALGMGGIKPNVEFQGGYEVTLTPREGTTMNAFAVRQAFEQAGFPGVNTKTSTVNGIPTVYATVPPVAGFSPDNQETNQRVRQAAGEGYEVKGISAVGPTIQQETITNAILAVAYSVGLIVLYLALRFGFGLGGFKTGLKFGLSAVAALLHDVVFVVGSAALLGILLGWEISALFVTAMLTVIGFSVHDTIVIFDRIRENLRRAPAGETFEFLIDKSVTQSFGRSINTSMTAIVTLAIMIFYGAPTPELKFMCATMLLGIVIGTYSSIFNASPILYLWDKAIVKSKGAQAGLIEEARTAIRMAQEQQVALAGGYGGGSPETVTPTAPTASAGAAGQYGQVRRRRSAVDQATKKLDDED